MATHAASGAESHAGAEAQAGEGAHGGGHGGGIEHIHEVPHALILLRNSVFLNNESARQTLHLIEPTFYSLIVLCVVAVSVRRATRRLSMAPGKMQNVVELAYEAMRKLVVGVMGEKHGRQHLPFIGALFFFIWFNNLMGLVPFLKAPTSMFQTTLALGLTTFCYVQFFALKMNGPWNYVYHLMGSPKGAVMWAMAPLMFVLELIGELIKPLSLSLRLFGNIMGEDILLYVFSFLGVTMLALGPLAVPIPLQFPFFFLALLTSTVQALVFALLATIYIALFIPHEAHGH